VWISMAPVIGREHSEISSFCGLIETYRA